MHFALPVCIPAAFSWAGSPPTYRCSGPRESRWPSTGLPVKDLAPISIIAANFLSIAIHPSVPAQTLKQFVDYAKANAGKLSYGHVGIGSTNHLTGELFKSLTGTPEIVQVPYWGAGPAIA